MLLRNSSLTEVKNLQLALTDIDEYTGTVPSLDYNQKEKHNVKIYSAENEKSAL